MTQWFRGNIEGYYVGRPARLGTLGTSNGRGFQLVVYRAAIRDVELLEFVPPSTVVEPSTGVASPATCTPPRGVGMESETKSRDATNFATNQPNVAPSAAGPSTAATSAAVSKNGGAEPEQPPLVLPPWLPAPGKAFFQPTITDARLFPVRHAMGWFEGPVHQVFIEDFRSTHSKHHEHHLYGRFEGRAHGYFALPPPPRPEAAERLLQAFQDLPDEALGPNAAQLDAHAKARELARDHAQVTSSASENSTGPTPDVRATKSTALAPGGPQPGTLLVDAAAVRPGKASVEPTNRGSNETKLDASSAVIPATAPPRSVGGKVPFLILVILVAAGLLLTCGAPRSLLWLFFLLPTLLVRRVVSGLVPDSTSLRGLSALVTLGQAWLAGMVFVGWWETGCRDVHPVPLIGTLTGLLITSVLPFDIPLLVNASTLAAILIGWCTGKDACHSNTRSARDAINPPATGALLEDNRS